MIKAAQHNKLRAKRIDYVEDEYTSCVFGEIRHYPVGRIWNFFVELVKKAGIVYNFDAIPHGVKFRFWPKFNNVEPDLVIDFYSDANLKNCILHIILEVKWNDRLAPSCELIRQWDNRDNEHEPWLQLYLTRSGTKGLDGIIQTKKIIDIGCKGECSNENHINEMKRFSKTQTREYKDSMGYITWSDIAQVADNNNFSGISNFLAKSGVGHFSGFNFINDYSYSYFQDFFDFSLYQDTFCWRFLNNFNFEKTECFFK